MNQDTSDSSFTLLDWLICAFLALPVLIFCAWFKWPVAVVLAALVVFGFYRTLRGTRFARFEVSAESLLMIGVVALAWTALAGVGHFFYANSDWVVRDAVLRDLTETAWPPAYPSGGDLPLILRAPVGYYLSAASVGALSGLGNADLALYFWTVVGFSLFVMGATTLFASTAQRWICGVVLVAFGGMDMLGYPLVQHTMPALGQHIEWWARFAQYSSNSTLLFWVPNHALPAWLGTVLVMRHWKKPELARLGPLLAAVIPLWSPLAAIGLAPFVILGIDWRRDVRALFAPTSALPLWAAALLLARYLTMDGQSIPGGWTISQFGSVAAFLSLYLPFCALEFGILALVLVPLRVYDRRLLLAVALLVLLPFYHFGPGNDLVMRASIPALTILALATVRPLADAGLSPWRFALAAILLVGAAGAAQEPERAFQHTRWDLTGQTLVQTMGKDGEDDLRRVMPHYVARLNLPALASLMRDPALVHPYGPPAPPAPHPAH